MAVPISAANPIPRDVLAALARACPAIADALPGCRLAVNHAFADGDDAPPIQSGDEVALIGMVSGG